MAGRQFREEAGESGDADRFGDGVPDEPDAEQGWSPLVGLVFVIGSSVLIWSLILFGALNWLRR